MTTSVRTTPTLLSVAGLISRVTLCVILANLATEPETGIAGDAATVSTLSARKTAEATAHQSAEFSADAASIQHASGTAFEKVELAQQPARDSQTPLPGLRLRPIRDLGVNITIQTLDDRGRTLLVPPKAPVEVLGAQMQETVLLDQVRPWPIIEYQWDAPALCYRPLYFEEINLERYGHSAGAVLQPLLSAAHFYGTVAALPGLLVVEPPCQCVYTLGHFRPGNCVPFELYCPRPRLDREVVTHCCFGECLHCSKLWDPEWWDELH